MRGAALSHGGRAVGGGGLGSSRMFLCSTNLTAAMVFSLLAILLMTIKALGHLDGAIETH
jgi:hypothetical protein